MSRDRSSVFIHFRFFSRDKFTCEAEGNRSGWKLAKIMSRISTKELGARRVVLQISKTASRDEMLPLDAELRSSTVRDAIEAG